MRIGLPVWLLSRSIDADGIAASVVKAGSGFERGPAASHKYWKRVRTFVDGKPAWKYYYNTARDKKRWMDERAAMIAAQRGSVKELEEAHREQHGVKAEFAKEHPLLTARRKLDELTVEYVQEILTWDRPPKVHLSPTAMSEYHVAVSQQYADGDTEPDDPHGKTIDVLRTMDLAFTALPPVIKQFFDGACADVKMLTSGEDPLFAEGAAGYCRPGRNGSMVVVDVESCNQHATGRGAHMKGGMFPVEVLIHEMAHTVHNQLGAKERWESGEGGPKGWEGRPTFADYEAFMAGPGKAEEPITGYAATNVYERWAESWTAAIMYPRDLASVAPLQYEWWRKFFGAEAMRPLNTDTPLYEQHQRAYEAAVATGDHIAAARERRAADMAVGVLDMAKDDRRLQWWLPKTTHVQTLLQEFQRYTTKNGDPYALTTKKLPDDKFFELSIGGRTVFMRIGRGDTDAPVPVWKPHEKLPGNLELKTSEIKEVYDAEGNPLTNDTAWWYLMQDGLPDGHPDIGGLSSMVVRGEKGSKNTKALDKFALNKKLSAIANAAGQGKLKQAGFSEAHIPVEVSETTFRLRSGTFAYDRWGMAGHSELQRLQDHGLPLSERKRLEEAFVAKQPGVQRVAAKVTQRDIDDGEINLTTGQPYTSKDRGRWKKPQIAREATEPGKAPTPVLRSIRYLNDNPDGTSTVIDVRRQDEGAGRGFYFIDSPVWRELLTPDGSHVESAQHMSELCARAAAERRKAWVSIKTDAQGGDTAHYYHVQVEFDGRGQPKLLGDEWKRRTGKDTPRLDDLLTPGTTVNGVETGRPIVKAEAIKLEKRPRIQPSKRELPVAGAAVILEVSNSEVGRRVDEPPGWERMPEGTPPMPAAGKSMSLWKQEREWRAKGILPATYNGSAEQRKWVSAFLEPAMKAWTDRQKRSLKVSLTEVIPAKKAGEPPRPPGWDRMPAGSDPFPDDDGVEKGNRLKADEKAWKKDGLLPKHYRGTATQRKWLAESFKPVMQVYEETKEEITRQELPAQYVFVAGKGSGFPGRVIRRWGDDHLRQTMREPVTTTPPKALTHDCLIYNHVVYNPVNGETVKDELRLLVPRDGTTMMKALDGVSGVKLVTDDGPPYLRVSIDGFNRAREYLGAVSLTADAERVIRRHTDMLKEAARRAQQKDHIVQIEDLGDIGALSRGEVKGFGPVDLRPTGPNGAPFILAEHQKELTQLTLDNGGRALGAHYMGTGKTITAIVTAKVAMAMRDPADPTKPHPSAPKKVLIVAPLNTCEQWRQACFDYSSGCTVVGAGSSDVPAAMFIDNVQRGVDTSDIVVCGPEYFTINQEMLRKAGFDGLIADEAHMGLKNEAAERNKAINEWNPDMKLLQLLTGTPITTGPADIMEYVKLLSKGEQWGDLSRKDFVERYLEVSAVPAEAGSEKKGSKVQIKPAKRAELAAIIAQWTHIAMAKDVRGKALPATRSEENKFAEMTGTQSLMYSMYLAALSPGDIAKLQGGGTLSDDEMAGLSKDAKKRVAKAKALSNCLAYKAASDDKYVLYTRKVPGKPGELKDEEAIFVTFDPKWLMERPDLPKDVRAKLAGRWPTIDHIGKESAAIYSALLRDVIGGDYESLAGQPVTAEQRQRMIDAGWPKQLANPDAGPVGIRCRGSDTPDNSPAYLARREQAQTFQRLFTNLLEGEVPADVPPEMRVTYAFNRAALQMNVDIEEAQVLLGTRPDAHVHAATASLNGVTVEEGETWFSDTRGSLHLLYRKDDWDTDNNRPRSAGGFEKVRDGDRVEVLQKYLPKPEIPAGLTKEQKQELKDDWVPPALTYDAQASQAAPSKDVVAVRRRDTNEIIWVPKSAINAMVASLMDPGMRAERAKADTAMVVGNAKAEELRLAVQEFHRVTGPGPAGAGRHGARQMVLFANGILDGCRTMEATMRTMGFKDVNEALEGSVHFDKDDPNPAGNGKYFVTYIGSTYTGDRDLNAEIFKKRKDKLGRDLPESLFVHKTNVGRAWRVWPAAEAHTSVQLSQWTPEARAAINKQFKIKPPEAFYTAPDGTRKCFYSSKTKVVIDGKAIMGSEALMREMVLTGDPTRMGVPRSQLDVMSPPDRADLASRLGLPASATVDAIVDAQGARAAAAKTRLEKLASAYEGLVKAEAVTDPPLTTKQMGVFNNCEFIVCSDAAQVGLNFGNATEMINYDSLSSPMAEWQRITRCARMLPPAVAEHLLGKPVLAPVLIDGEPAMNDDGTPAMAVRRDAKGMAVRDGSGPFAKIKAMEANLFAPAPRSEPQGVVTAMKVAGRDIGDMPFGRAIDAIAERAHAEATLASTKEQSAAWERIGKKARVAGNLGTNATLAFLHEMSDTQVPGGVGNVVSMGDPVYDDPMEGTYDEVDTTEAEATIRAAIDANLSEADRAMVAQAGFVAPGEAGDKGGSLDAAGIYLALRSQEIIEHIEYQRDVVGGRMRAAPGGVVVTDADVMNAVIDSLTPSDRAILKRQKYLVNVRKLAVSAHVPHMVQVQTDLGPVPVFAGFHKQHPVDTERNTRNTSRARMTSFEQLYADVQAKTPVHTDFDYETTTAADIANVSRLDVHKSMWRLGFIRKAQVAVA